MKTKLTSSRLAALRKCPRLHYYRYELGLARIREATPLRLGRAFHKGLELRAGLFGQDTQTILGAVVADYDVVPNWADATEWAVERETLRGAAAAATSGGTAATTSSTSPSSRPSRSRWSIPVTDARSRTFTVAGKIDGIVRLPDGRLAVLEYKTAGEDIAPDAEYWLRLRCDGQISLYVLAARACGFNVATVLYDVTRKPTIRLRQNETPEAYGQRLLADIGERPDYYYQRREVPRLEDELGEFRDELWQQAQHLIDLRRRASNSPIPPPPTSATSAA